MNKSKKRGMKQGKRMKKMKMTRRNYKGGKLNRDFELFKKEINKIDDNIKVQFQLYSINENNEKIKIIILRDYDNLYSIYHNLLKKLGYYFKMNTPEDDVDYNYVANCKEYLDGIMMELNRLLFDLLKQKNKYSKMRISRYITSS
jgi:hypothetical protein